MTAQATAQTTTNTPFGVSEQAPVVIYSTPVCPYCIRAKQLLQRKGVAYEDIDLASQPELRMAVMQHTRMRTVPQIFVKGTFVGGFDQLYALEQQGKLDQLLAG